MRYLLTGKQMRKADAYTIEKVGLPALVLMERAALEVVRVIELERCREKSILVVCGSGNNGGDGYAVARLLHIKGYDVSIYFAGDEASRSKENLLQKQICEHYQVPVVKNLKEKEYNIIVDAVFGIGLSREIAGEYREVIKTLNSMKGLKIAVDIPSGLHDTSGKVMGIAFRADMTIAIAYLKSGEVLPPANEYTGEIEIADIGIYDDAVPTDEPLFFTHEYNDLKKLYPKRQPNSHKGTYGKVGLIVGNKDMSGAAYLCAKAAYITGAGLVQIYTHEENRVALQQLMPEAIITTYDKFDGEKLQKLLDWSDVIGIGCGLGQNDLAEELVKYTLAHADCPCVVDADGLNILAKHMELLKDRAMPTILTPHMKEMTRLLSCKMDDLKENRLELLGGFTDEYPVTCVLKDARTLVSKAGQSMCLNMSGNAAMAKGGSGDVLTGMIAGILAQKLTEFDAASLAVYLHGHAGDVARDKKGVYSVLASDILDCISAVLKHI